MGFLLRAPRERINPSDTCPKAGNQSWESGWQAQSAVGPSCAGCRNTESCAVNPRLANLTNLSTTALFESKSFVFNITSNNFNDQMKLDSLQPQINGGPLLEAQWTAHGI